VLHRPILVDITPGADGDPDTTLERTLTMQVPALTGEPQLAAELAGCAFVLIGPNKLHGSTDAADDDRSLATLRRAHRQRIGQKVHGSIGFDEARGYLVVDENSRNGTRVNGQSLTPGAAAPVYAGAQVAFGDATFVFLDPPTLRKLARLAT
jgi:hypothetical protein